MYIGVARKQEGLLRRCWNGVSWLNNDDIADFLETSTEDTGTGYKDK